MKWTIRGLLITPILALVAVFLGGGGHGFAEPMLICFPWSYAFKFQNENAVWALIILQFPAYGLLVDLTTGRPLIGAKVIAGLTFLHLLLILIGFLHQRGIV